MRNRFYHYLPVLNHLGSLFWILGFLLLVPLVVLGLDAAGGRAEVSPLCFLGPAACSLLIGRLLKRWRAKEPLDDRGAMLVCALGWVLLSAVSALPFCMGIRAGFLDAYFESVSGYTTTGITMFMGLDDMPRSILFWRAFMQWLGGIGILAFLLMVMSAGSASHRLFRAESNKIVSQRPTPGLLGTVRILWTIYTCYTILIAALLMIAGVGVFDAIAHSFTLLATGGFSTHDSSIAYFRQSGYVHYRAIEYILILGMLLGGINFFVHFRLVRGDVRCLWDTMEIRLWWLLLAGFSAFVFLDHGFRAGFGDVEEGARTSLFHVATITTTCGFTTTDLSGPFFGAFAKQAFVVLMVIGACVGSTAGGIKVLRIGILFKVLVREVLQVAGAASAVNLVIVDGEEVDREEIRRVSALFFGWLLLLFIGAAITALLSDVGAMESVSIMATAQGNVGACLATQDQIMHLHPLVKITYIFGMLAGRLELVPVFMLLCRRTWA